MVTGREERSRVLFVCLFLTTGEVIAYMFADEKDQQEREKKMVQEKVGRCTGEKSLTREEGRDQECKQGAALCQALGRVPLE